MKIVIRRAMNREGFSFWLYQDDGQITRVMKPCEISFEERISGGAWELPEPTGFIRTRDFDELKASLLQELAEAGMIDPGSADTAKELKATKYHLEDMRRLALPAVST